MPLVSKVGATVTAGKSSLKSIMPLLLRLNDIVRAAASYVMITLSPILLERVMSTVFAFLASKERSISHIPGRLNNDGVEFRVFDDSFTVLLPLRAKSSGEGLLEA